MLSFSSEFPVERTEVTEFYQAIAQWLGESPHTEITKDEVLDLATSDKPHWERGSETLDNILVDDGDRRSAAFRYRKTDLGVAWTTTVCFDSDTVDSWVSVQTERHSVQAQAYVPSAKKPYVVRSLADFLRGGLDGELRVSEKAKLLTDADLNMVARILNGDSDHHLPVIYVSKPFDGQSTLDVDALAKHVHGVAHVMVEPSRDFSRRLQHETHSSNPFGGYVGIYFAADISTTVLVSSFETEFDARKDIFQRVRSSLLNRRPLPRCSWSTIQGRLAKAAREKLKLDSKVDDYVTVFDREMEAKEEQLREAESEIQRLKAALSGAVRLGNTAKSGIKLSCGSEQELAEDEFSEVLLDALTDARKNETDNSRRADVIDIVLRSNNKPSTLANNRQTIKQLLKGYKNMTGPIRSGLQDLGFSITEQGKHYKIRYRDDSRYSCSLPKSGSDHRGGMNAASEIAKKFF